MISVPSETRSNGLSAIICYLPQVMLLPLLKPFSRTHLGYEIEMVIDMGMNGAKTVKKNTVLTIFTLPAS